MNRRDLLKAAIGIPLAAKTKVLPGRWVRHTIKTPFKPMDPWALVELVDFGDGGFRKDKLPELLQVMRELR